jgi:hypothetical protein
MFTNYFKVYTITATPPAPIPVAIFFILEEIAFVFPFVPT